MGRKYVPAFVSLHLIIPSQLLQEIKWLGVWTTNNTISLLYSYYTALLKFSFIMGNNSWLIIGYYQAIINWLSQVIRLNTLDYWLVTNLLILKLLPNNNLKLLFDNCLKLSSQWETWHWLETVIRQLIGFNVPVITSY